MTFSFEGKTALVTGASRGIGRENAIALGTARALLDDPQLKEFYAGRAALGRIGTTADTAAVVAFLASQHGGWITGQVLEASGGMHL